MGEFISISGVIGSDQARVEHALRAYAAARGGNLAAQVGTLGDENMLLLSESASGVTVMYPDSFLGWDDASAFLSEHLNTPVFSFHIHDGDLWMFILYERGEAVAQFNPIPDYWDDSVSSDEIESWSGDAESVARHIPNLQPANIERYFTRWDLDADAPAKAYPDDEFTYGDCWQLSDFMRRVGLQYPVDEQGTVRGATFHFRISNENAG